MWGAVVSINDDDAHSAYYHYLFDYYYNADAQCHLHASNVPCNVADTDNKVQLTAIEG